MLAKFFICVALCLHSIVASAESKHIFIKDEPKFDEENILDLYSVSLPPNQTLQTTNKIRLDKNGKSIIYIANPIHHQIESIIYSDSQNTLSVQLDPNSSAFKELILEQRLHNSIKTSNFSFNFATNKYQLTNQYTRNYQSFYKTDCNESGPLTSIHKCLTSKNENCSITDRITEDCSQAESKRILEASKVLKSKNKYFSCLDKNIGNNNLGLTKVSLSDFKTLLHEDTSIQHKSKIRCTDLPSPYLGKYDEKEQILSIDMNKNTDASMIAQTIFHESIHSTNNSEAIVQLVEKCCEDKNDQHSCAKLSFITGKTLSEKSILSSNTHLLFYNLFKDKPEILLDYASKVEDLNSKSTCKKSNSSKKTVYKCDPKEEQNLLTDLGNYIQNVCTQNKSSLNEEEFKSCQSSAEIYKSQEYQNKCTFKKVSSLNEIDCLNFESSPDLTNNTNTTLAYANSQQISPLLLPPTDGKITNRSGNQTLQEIFKHNPEIKTALNPTKLEYKIPRLIASLADFVPPAKAADTPNPMQTTLTIQQASSTAATATKQIIPITPRVPTEPGTLSNAAIQAAQLFLDGKKSRGTARTPSKVNPSTTTRTPSHSTKIASTTNLQTPSVSAQNTADKQNTNNTIAADNSNNPATTENLTPEISNQIYEQLPPELQSTSKEDFEKAIKEQGGDIKSYFESRGYEYIANNKNEIILKSKVDGKTYKISLAPKATRQK